MLSSKLICVSFFRKLCNILKKYLTSFLRIFDISTSPWKKKVRKVIFFFLQEKWKPLMNLIMDSDTHLYFQIWKSHFNISWSLFISLIFHTRNYFIEFNYDLQILKMQNMSWEYLFTCQPEYRSFLHKSLQHMLHGISISLYCTIWSWNPFVYCTNMLPSILFTIFARGALLVTYQMSDFSFSEIL